MKFSTVNSFSLLSQSLVQ